MIAAAVLNIVELGMAARQCQRFLTHVQTLHALGPGQCGMDPEGSRMTKHLQYLRTGGESGGGEAIIALIAEPAGLLTSSDIHVKTRRALIHLQGRGASSAQKPCD